MNEEYSSNNPLRDFAKDLGFKLYIFDDPQSGSQTRLFEQSKGGEIDAVMYYQNVVCLVSITKASGEDLESKIRKFFEKLDRIQSVKDIHFDLRPGKGRNSGGMDKPKKMLNRIKNHIKYIIKQEYKPILVKLFFCPNGRLDEKYGNEYSESKELVIDKDIFEYFQEVGRRLNKEFLFNDFMHFLGVNKVDLERKGPSKTNKPEKTTPFRVNRLELKKDKIIMYSLPIAVGEISDYVTVLRLARKYDKRGFQRMVKAPRLEKINEEYLSKNETFPNNIIIALNPEIYVQENEFYDGAKEEITFFKEFNSLIIIDGQHRFFSFVKGGKTNRRILVTLLFFKKNDKERDKEKSYLQMVRMFYEINKTQERIDPNLSFILKARIDPKSPENFWFEVFKKLDETGFFAKRFTFKETTMKERGKKSVISVITYGGVLRLNESYRKNGVYVEGLRTFYTKDESKNVEFAYNLLKNYFDIIEDILHDQNLNKNELSPREIGALLRLIRHFIISDKDKVNRMGTVTNIRKSKDTEDAETVEYFKEILGLIQFEKVLKLQYPSSNWAAVEGYMLGQIHRSKLDFGNKNLLSKKGREIYEKLTWQSLEV